MNYMEKVAEILGLELEEKFTVKYSDTNNFGIYKLTKNGLQYYSQINKRWHMDVSSDLEYILTGCYKIEWQPEEGERYYFPSFQTPSKWDYSTWHNSKYDKGIKIAVGIYKTNYEAQQKAKELGWLNES